MEWEVVFPHVQWMQIEREGVEVMMRVLQNGQFFHQMQEEMQLPKKEAVVKVIAVILVVLLLQVPTEM